MKKTWKKTVAKTQSEYNKKRRDKLKSLCLCYRCKTKIENTKKTYCNDCREDYRKVQNKIRDNNLSLSLCKWCGKIEKIDGITSCYVCVLKYTSLKYFKTNKKWIDLLSLFEKQKGICPYTGYKLIIGVNCSLDHIISRSKGGLNDFSNLQWVLKTVNSMKGNLEHNEFLELCRIISDFNKNKSKIKKIDI